MRGRIERIREICRGKTVLDVGVVGDSADGEFWNDPYWLHGHIQRVAKRVIGVDTSRTCVNRLRANGYNHIWVGNAERFISELKYDVVVAGELIEHLKNVGNFLDCVKKNLKNGGKLVITTPNLYSARLFFLGHILGIVKSSEHHVCGFTPPILRRLLESNGWIVEELETIPREKIPTLKGKILTKLCPSFLQNTIYCVARRGER